MKPISIIIIFLTAFSAICGPLQQISSQISDPERYLKQNSMVLMGNSSIDKAQIVFLPEVHDDPKSLLTQLLLIAREKQKDRNFLVLDESLGSMKKSQWDIFSQKSLEIIAAESQRKSRQKYTPKSFEDSLQTLANKFRNDGQLNQQAGLWSIFDLSNETPFLGWDRLNNASLTERNEQMVATLKNAIKSNQRILIMAGARHVPELEYLTSKKLLCDTNKASDMDKFFWTIKNQFGKSPELSNGIGATLPIYDFLKKSSVNYAVAFSKDIYPELDHVIDQFRAGQRGCFRL